MHKLWLLASTVGKGLLQCVLIVALTFLFCRTIPGDAVDVLGLEGGLTAEQAAAIRQALKLDDPWLVQFGDWLSAASRGDLGQSLRFGRSVSDMLLNAIPVTLQLAGWAFVLGLFLALGLSLWAAARQSAFADSLVEGLNAWSIAMPTFCAGVIFILLFCIELHWLPVIGSFVLPAVIMGLDSGGTIVKPLREELKESAALPYVRTAKAKGLQPQRSRLTPESRIDFLGEPLPIENDARMRRWRGCSISMIFQDPMSCLNPYLRVGTQILEALKRGSASDEDPHARVLELLEMVDLPEPKQTAGKYPYELSGGQQQRIMIAMALANRPQLLIADEPTSSLDACVQAEILKLLERLQKAFSLSMLFITHNMAAARFLAHRVYVLQHGRMAESGDTAAVFAHPREAYTAELIRAKENLAALQPVACEAQNNASPVGELSNVSYAYPAAGFCRRAQPTLKDISLRIYPGETLGILGESGSGKSTIAKLLAGLVQPSQGKVSLFEEDISRTRKMALALRKRCQIVFQNPFGALNPRLTVEAALREPLELMNLESHAQERIREALQSVSLPEDFLARYPHELSGGQRQRVCIARGILSHPDLLICDEIVSALDPTVQVQVLLTLHRLQQERRFAMFFISHDLDVVEHISTKIAVVYRGSIVEYGPAEAVMNRPKHPYTQKLIQANRMASTRA